MRSCIASVGARLAYWIWLKLGARLSEVACPAARIASLIVQVPVCGSIASLVYFEAVYIRQTASMAPGARAEVCGLALLLAPIAAQRGMGVSVAGGVFVQPRARFPVGHTLLAVAGHRVVLGIGGDGRAALAV